MPLEEVIPTNDYIIVDGELYHYGVKGMKWGVRRYQNKDGTSTSLGKKRRQNLKSEASLMNRIKGPDDIDGWANLQKEINTKSGNFYFGEGVSPEFKKAIKEYRSKIEEMNQKYDFPAGARTHSGVENPTSPRRERWQSDVRRNLKR